ncbi:MAG TPA: APC family permease [Actinomycetota bacterium]
MADRTDLEYERLGGKKLSLVDVVAQSVGFMGPVFSAAFLIPLIAGYNATGKGAGKATPFAVVLASIGVFAMGWIVAQYAKRIHAAGSLYDYVSNGFGVRIGAVAGWLYYGATTVLASAIAVLIGGLIHDILLLEFGFDAIPYWVYNVVFVGLVFLVMWSGVQISTRVQLSLALVSAVVILIFLLYVIMQAPTQDLSAFTPGAADQGWSGILFGVLYGVLIFVGFETAANLAEETAEPKRSIPRAVLLSVVIVAAFYLIASYAQLAGFGFDVAAFTSQEVNVAGPIFILSAPPDASPYSYGGVWIGRLVELVVLLDIMAVGVGAAVASSRGVFALARDRRVPAPFAKVSASKGTPIGAICFVSGWSLFVVLWELWGPGVTALDGYFPMFAWLSTFGGFSLTFVYLLMSAGSFKGLADHPNRVGVVIASLIGIVVAGGAVFGGIYKQSNPFDKVWIVALLWLVLGVIVTSLMKGREPASRALDDLSSAG